MFQLTTVNQQNTKSIGQKCVAKLKSGNQQHGAKFNIPLDSTQFQSFRGRDFYRSDDPTSSVKALKEYG